MLVRFSVVSYAITAALCSLLVVNTVHAATDIESQLAGMVDRLFAQAALTQPVTVAVLPFESQLGSDSKAGTGVAEFLVSVLSGRPGVTLVDRSSFSKVMGEIALSQSGAFDENQFA